MNISELSLKRPVLATVMNLMIILFGVVGFSFLAVRDYPAIDPPIINVSTSYTGRQSGYHRKPDHGTARKTNQRYTRHPDDFIHQFPGEQQYYGGI